jgi:hypothetical protein
MQAATVSLEILPKKFFVIFYAQNIRRVSSIKNRVASIRLLTVSILDYSCTIIRFGLKKNKILYFFFISLISVQ